MMRPVPAGVLASEGVQWWSGFRPPLILFAVLVAGSLLGQYIFYAYDTSPAVFWPPAGIALAAVLLGGYRMWIPIACASFVSAFVSASVPTFTVVAGATLAQTLAPVAGAYLLKQFGVDISFGAMRDALIFSASALLIAAIAPTILTAVQLFAHTLPDTFYVVWSGSWAGHLLSIMILTPLLTTWIPWRRFNLTYISDRIEASGVFLSLSGTIYMLFWTSAGQSLSFLLLLILLMALFWIALRFNIRAMTLGLFLFTLFAMLGTLLSPHASATPLGARLFSAELLIILIAPIFLAFAALMRERWQESRIVEEHVRRLEAAMQRLNSEGEAKSEFIAILAHELRNPLSAILSSTELLKLQEMQIPGGAPLLKTIDERVRGMGRLLDDLLDTVRISQKKFNLDKDTVSLNLIIDRSVDTARVLLHRRRHTLSITKPDEDLYLYADPVRLEQIIVNLLSNAAKYTESGGSIELKAFREGPVVAIYVRDSGIGIPKNMFTRIFEPFFQIEGGKKMGGGLGIGLSLTKRLVEMHGGTIGVTSQGENQGSEFVIRLPLPGHASLPAGQDATILRSGSKLRQTKRTQRILVVDDNESTANAIGKLLALRGHEVALAYTGADAIQKARELQPQSIILDIGLPDTDGYTVARTLRQEKSFSPVIIALTGYGQAADKEKARAAGFNYHLTKPAGLKEIEAILRKVPRGEKD
ncbi:MAG: ATP-binding protein [Patescibacteria group bacterium]|nr:ATP-binding protein [bacterium]MDZ4227080.1 ATP-binding protein [Patescibacteria group bacterium]